MKILVPVKRVAALEEDFRIRDDGRDVDPDDLNYDLNEWDSFSLEQAVLIKEAASGEVQVVAVAVGPQECDEILLLGTRSHVHTLTRSHALPRDPIQQLGGLFGGHI